MNTLNESAVVIPLSPTGPIVETPHHYFASTAFGWAVGATRQECIDRLARQAGAETIKRLLKEKSGGLYVWTCCVDVAKDTKYDINWYQPQGVPISKAQEFNIVNIKGDIRLIEKV